MTEILFLIKVLRDYIKGETTDSAPAELDWEKFSALAKQQECGGLVFYQCKGLIPAGEVYKRFERALQLQVYLYVLRKTLIDALSRRFAAEHIVHGIVKGVALTSYYQRPEHRSMGDVDIMIEQADQEKAYSVMMDLGYECLQANGIEKVYKKQDIVIEMHSSLVHLHEGNEYLLEYFNSRWNQTVDKDYRAVLNINFHFIYLIQHLSGHFLLTGIGIRQFVDIALMLEKETSLDWEYIRSELEGLRLWDFFVKCMEFCKKAFDCSTPFGIGPMEDTLYRQTILKMQKDGVFGRLNEDNAEMKTLMEARAYQGNTGERFLVKNLIYSIFPPYSRLIQLSYCKFVIGRKWLIGFAWIKRIVHILTTGKLAKFKSEKYVADWQKAEVKERVDYVSRWGL